MAKQGTYTGMLGCWDGSAINYRTYDLSQERDR